MVVSGAVISQSLTSFAGLAANFNGQGLHQGICRSKITEKNDGMVSQIKITISLAPAENTNFLCNRKKKHV